VELYTSTAGEAWHRNDNWLVGEPCVNRWYGVICCPDTHPHLNTINRYRNDFMCESSTDSTDRREPYLGGGRAAFVGGATQINRRLKSDGFQYNGDTAPIFPQGCSSGIVTGTSADIARCVVTGLALTGNNLNGSISDASIRIPNLAVLKLGNNHLTGPVPSGQILSLASQISGLAVDLGGNSFDADFGSDVHQQCQTGRMRCEGYPPESCSAFGSSYVVRTDRPTTCIQCDGENWRPVLAIVGSFVAFLLVISAYAFFTIRFPEFTAQSVGTWSIFATHLQTLNIISSLRLAWPPSADVVIAIDIFNGFNFESARPECLTYDPVVAVTQAPAFTLPTVLTFAKLGFPLFFITIFSILRGVVRLLHRLRCLRWDRATLELRIDTLEVVETTVYALTLSSTWKAAYTAWTDPAAVGAPGSLQSSYTLAQQVLEFSQRWEACASPVAGATPTCDPVFKMLSFMLAILVITLQVLYFLKYVRNTILVIHMENAELGLKWKSVGWKKPVLGRHLEINELRLELQHNRTRFDRETVNKFAIKAMDKSKKRMVPTWLRRDDFVKVGGNFYVPDLDWEGAARRTSINKKTRRTPCYESVSLWFTGRSITLEQLRRRTRFLCRRFAAHAPYWQFTIWIRQLVMTILTMLCSARPGAADCIDPINPSNSSQLYESIEYADAFISIQSSLALSIIVITSILQWYIHPFAFKHQNWLEQWFLSASGMSVALAFLYTHPPTRTPFVEAVLVTCLAGAIAAAGIFLLIMHRKHAKEVRYRLSIRRAQAGGRRLNNLTLGRDAMSQYLPADSELESASSTTETQPVEPLPPHTEADSPAVVDRVSVSKHTDLQRRETYTKIDATAIEHEVEDPGLLTEAKNAHTFIDASAIEVQAPPSAELESKEVPETDETFV
jgi:hypothetical protein